MDKQALNIPQATKFISNIGRKAVDWARQYSKSHPWRAGAAGAVGGGGIALATGIPQRLVGFGSDPLGFSSPRGRKQMAADAGTMNDAAGAILKTLIGVGLLSGAATGVSHILRDSDSEIDDPESFVYDENAMGVVPQKSYKKKAKVNLKSDAPPSAWIDPTAWKKAPKDSGSPLYDSIFSPVWAIPGLAAAIGAGYFGGKGIADLIGYRLRGYPAKKRMEDAKREFEETIAGLSKGAALNERLERGFKFYKRSGVMPGIVLTGVGGLGLLSALAAYHRFRTPTPVDVYRDQLNRYVRTTGRPIIRVRPRAELNADEKEEEDDDKEDSAAKAAAYPRAEQQVQQATIAANRNPFRFSTLSDEGSQDYANNMLVNYEETGPDEQRQMENTISNAKPSGDEAQTLANVAGELTTNQRFLSGAFDALAQRAGLPTEKRATAGSWLLSAWENQQQEAKRVADNIGDGVVNAAQRLKDRMLKTAPERYGAALVNGDVSAFTTLGGGGGSGPEGAISAGIADGIKNNLAGGIKNPLTSTLVGRGMQNSSQTGSAGTSFAGAPPAGGKPQGSKPSGGSFDQEAAALFKQADMQSAFRQAGENFGKAWAETPGGLSDRVNSEIVPKFVDERVAPNMGPLGGVLSRAFSGRNDSWGNTLGNALFGGERGVYETRLHANNPGYGRVGGSQPYDEWPDDAAD